MQRNHVIDAEHRLTEAVRVGSDIRYADSGGVFIAYQVLGDGDHDLLVFMDGFIPIDTMDDEPRLAASMRRLASFSRVMRFDRRGIGLSDPVSPHAPPTLEQWVEDGLAVLDVVGSKKAIVVSAAEASPVALLFSATHSDRVEGLVIVNGFARVLVDDDYPEGLPREAVDAILSTTDPSQSDASVEAIRQFAPSAADDEYFRQWWIEAGRRGASPATARALLTVAFESDVRSVLATVRMPVLVACLAESPAHAGSRYLAANLPSARYFEIAGADDYWWSADAARIVLDEIEEFVTGSRHGRSTDRRLTTLLFTDIVGSTARTATIGDQRWHEMLDQHDATVRRQLGRYRGREINTTGDGFLATFDGPARAVECAHAIRDATRRLGVDVRIGIHTGEVEVRGDDVAGTAVNIAARVASLAEPGAIWISRTVADLVAGSGLELRDLGEHELKGLASTWRLYSVEI
jgi:class 3 adenylate cyclase